MEHVTNLLFSDQLISMFIDFQRTKFNKLKTLSIHVVIRSTSVPFNCLIEWIQFREQESNKRNYIQYKL